MTELHQDILSQLEKVGDVYVVGGIVRDLAFYGANERPISDIDFVITGRVRALDTLATRLGATRNRFGGYGLKRGGYKIDFWSLHNTWAKVNRHVRVNSAKDLVKTTFFDWDAVVYGVSTREIYAMPGYIDRLNKRILDINLEENPSIQGNLVRALRRLVMWDAKPGRKLNVFLSNYLDQANWPALISAEKGAFHTCYLHQFHTGLEFRRKVLCRSEGYVAGVDSRRQRSFDFI
ncbi:MAG: hypothetical protein ACK4HV_09130 [Parachlamydiaceae bacterium]